MAERVLKTDFKRIGRSGPTVDGRIINPTMIDEMAASYDKSLFTAMIWPDHQRWQNYGTVEELRAEDNEEGGRDLYAVLSPNALYLSDNRFGQKLFTSMEVIFDFRKTGKAYLGGLGATDDPASVATSEIRFSKTAEHAGIILTKNVEATDKTFQETIQLSLIEQLMEKFSLKPKGDDDMADKAVLDALKQEFAALKASFDALKPADPVEKKPDEQFAALTARLDALETKFSELKPAGQQDADADQYAAVKNQLDALMIKLTAALGEQDATDGGEHFNAEGEFGDYM